jgi:NitT/TauT family transport system ATP-binding protein
MTAVQLAPSAAESTAAAITVDIAAHDFGAEGQPTLRALDNVRFQVEPQSFVSLIGPSGCGKTTLLRSIGGLNTPTDGRVLIGDQEITGPPESVAFVFQEHNLLPWRTAIHNVEFGLELAGVPRRERRDRARAALERVGLGKFEKSFPGQLSGGMRQRVGIARAMCLEPEILLLDEPFGALDIMTREVMQDFLLELLEEQRRTVVLVTHSVEEAVYLSDRVLVMSAGPGRVKDDVLVDLPRPRSADPHIRSSSELVACREHVTELLRSELKRSDPSGLV